MVILYKDPKGEKIFDRGQSQGTLNLTAADEARIEQFGDLEKHCLELESRLSKYEVSLTSIDAIFIPWPKYFRLLHHSKV